MDATVEQILGYRARDESNQGHLWDQPGRGQHIDVQEPNDVCRDVRRVDKKLQGRLELRSLAVRLPHHLQTFDHRRD